MELTALEIKHNNLVYFASKADSLWVTVLRSGLRLLVELAGPKS